MLQKRHETNLDVINTPSLFKIVYLQKMTFEQARLEKNYSVMREALRNILDNLISKAKKEGKTETVNNIKKALNWYDTIGFNKKYIKRLPNGEIKLILPNNIEMKVDYAMSYTYSQLNKLIEDLNIV